jgi:hypothetical protein
VLLLLLLDQIRMRPQSLVGFGLTMQNISHWSRWSTADCEEVTRKEVPRVMGYVAKKRAAGRAEATR